jgi:hypothetical protein
MMTIRLCAAVACPTLVVPDNGYIDSVSSDGRTVTWACNSGYELKWPNGGSGNTSLCNVTGIRAEWNDFPQCLRKSSGQGDERVWLDWGSGCCVVSEKINWTLWVINWTLWVIYWTIWVIHWTLLERRIGCMGGELQQRSARIFLRMTRIW